MSEEKSLKALSIAKDFMEAAGARQDRDRAFEQRLIEAEGSKMGYVDMFDQLEIAMEFMTLKQRLGDAADNNKRYRKLAFELAENAAKLCEDVCSDEELKEFLPANANDSDVIEGLQQNGAPSLSGICARLG